MAKMLEIKSAKGNCTISMSEEFMVFGLMDDEGRELLKLAVEKLNEFEEKYIAKHPENPDEVINVL